MWPRKKFDDIFIRVKILILGVAYPPRAPTEVKFCMAKRTHVPLGHAKFHVNRYNESRLRMQKC